jgi:hypothetical protein
VLLTKYYPNNEIKIEISRACGMRGGQDRCMQGFVGRPEGESHLEGIELDARIILEWIFSKWAVGSKTGSSWLRIGTGGGHL